jgi:Peptidase propeptide and YPEB domain
MKTTTFGVWCAAGLLPAIAGCGSSDNSKVIQDSAEISQDTARQDALTYVPGTGGDVEKIETADEHRWGVTVQASVGAEVVVELERTDGHLDEITSQKAPFEYDLPAAMPGFVTFAKAREAAVAAKPGNVEAWEENFISTTWEIYTRDTGGKLWEVKLDAKTGAVISTIQKDQPD